MRLKQSQYEKLILFLSLLNCVKLFFYGNKIIDSISLGITAAALFFIFFNTNLIYSRRVVFLCCCVLCSLLVTVVINGGVGASANYAILMLTSMLFVSYGISKHAMNKLFVFNGLILLSFLFTLAVVKVNSFYFFTTITGASINSNMVGIVALLAFYFLVQPCFAIKNRICKALGVISVVGSCFYFILISECRSVLFSVSIFIILNALIKQQIDSKTFYRVVSLSQIFSLLFVACYLILYNCSININLDFFGKTFFSGRQTVWQSVFDLFLKHPLIGSGGKETLKSVNGTVTTSAHNTLLSIIYIFGAIPTCCFFSFWGKKYDKAQTNPRRVNQIIVLSVVVITFLESFYMESYLVFLSVLFFLPELKCRCNLEQENNVKLRSSYDTENNSLLLVRW